MIKRKILITGSSGQLGSTLVNLLSNKFSVIPTSKSAPVNQEKSPYYLNMLDRNSIKYCLTTFKPEIIINCAAITNVDQCEINHSIAHDINVKGLQDIINFSSKHATIIQISSDYLFDGKNPPYSEDDIPMPINYYGRTKLEAENILRGSRRKFLIIRTNVNYSSNLNIKSNFFGWVYNSLLMKEVIHVVNDQRSNPAFVDNLANLIFKSILLNCEGIFHYGSLDSISRYEFAILIAKTFNFRENLIKCVDSLFLYDNVSSYIAQRPTNTTLKTETIEKLLNVQIFSTKYSLNKIKLFLNQ